MKVFSLENSRILRRFGYNTQASKTKSTDLPILPSDTGFLDDVTASDFVL